MKHRKQAPLRSDIAWSTPDRIGVFGYDLPRELIHLGDMGFLEIVGRLPTAAESKVFNALLVTLVEHGVTPSAIATRMTYAGAPESMQAAVAAGLLGLGTVFVGTIEGAARILSTAIPDPTPTSSSWLNLVERLFAEITRQRIRRGVFHSVPKLEAAIVEWINHRNAHPKPFIRTATAKSIILKRRRAKESLANLAVGCK